MSRQSIPKSQRLIVLYRVEPGSLGPDGAQYVDAFCRYAQDELEKKGYGYIYWQIVARHDKSLPEIQFGLLGKVISQSQANKYLQLHDSDLDQFDSELSDHIADLIDHYMGDVQ